MSVRERSAKDELLRQQQQLAQQESERNLDWAWSLEQIAWQMRHETTGHSWGGSESLWPPGGAPGPGMRF